MNTNLDDTKRDSRFSAHGQAKQKLLVETVEKLTGGIAHKFNNLLTIIQGNTQLLLVDAEEGSQAHKSLKEILSASQQAAEMTRQLLSFGKRKPISYTPIDVNNIIDDVIQIVRPECDPNIQILEDLETESPMAIGDYGLVHSALLSLLVNAREAMPEGGKMDLKTSLVTIEPQSSHADLQPGQYIDICIHDSGKKAIQHHMQHLSEDVTVFDLPVEQNLQTAYECAKQLKGTLEISTEPQAGTEVHMYIPAVYTPETKEEEPVQEIRQNILVVDDDKTILELIGRMLQKLGYEVITCNDGPDAISAYEKNHANIDLVIVDIIMPKMNGFETLEALKKINPKVKALLASGFTAETERNRALQLGFIDFLEKPFRFDRLKHCVETCLPKHAVV